MVPADMTDSSMITLYAELTAGVTKHVFADHCLQVLGLFDSTQGT